MTDIERPDLDAIDAQADAATKGPWGSMYNGNSEHNGKGVGMSRMTVLASPFDPRSIRVREPTVVYLNDEDAAFVAAARTNVPRLTAYARHCETLLVAQRTQIEALTEKLADERADREEEENNR